MIESSIDKDNKPESDHTVCLIFGREPKWKPESKTNPN